MRTIKFRAADKFTNKFIYGDVLRTSNGIKICNENGDYEVKPETLGQYTGFADNKDEEKEIFEGDNMLFMYKDVEYSGEVKFEEGMFILCNEYLPDSYIPLFDIVNSYDSEFWVEGKIVGNIYDK